MALPTTNLTLHCDAKDTDQVFTTGNGGGPGVHTGTPGDGDLIDVWDDEGDGIADVALITQTTGPNYRIATPLMKHPCLDFDGSVSVLTARDQADMANKASSSFIANNAFTILMAFWAESITTTSSSPYNNHMLIGDSGGFWGLHLRDDTGTLKLQGYSFDGSEDFAEVAVTTGATYIAVFQHSGGNLLVSVIDDTGTESGVASASSGNTTDLTNVMRLSRGFGAASFYNGRIGEFAIYNAVLTGADFTNAKQYFIDQWMNVAAPAGNVTGKIWSPTLISHPALIS